MENELDSKIKCAIIGSALSNCEISENASDTDVMKAEDTIEGTYAKRHSSPAQFGKSAIDIDDAKWQKEYEKNTDANYKKLEDCGLIQCMKDIGILYDENQFKRTYVVSGDRAAIDKDVKKSEYDEVEAKFDEQNGIEVANNKKNVKCIKMSVVWARDVGDFGDCSSKCLDALNNGGIEGYSGSPSHFIDVNDKCMANLVSSERKISKENFNKNIGIVKELIKNGTLYPTEMLIQQSIEKLKRIRDGK